MPFSGCLLTLYSGRAIQEDQEGILLGSELPTGSQGSFRVSLGPVTGPVAQCILLFGDTHRQQTSKKWRKVNAYMAESPNTS